MNINNNDVFQSGKLPMINYIVPFCFDGQNFAWSNLQGRLRNGCPEKRNICLANVLNNLFQKNNTKNINPYKKDIDKNFGHISPLKTMDKEKNFLVHSLNFSEIRQLNNDFTLLESFQHIGDEIYSVDIYYSNEYLRNRDNGKESSNLDFLLVIIII